ncbi:hypothetical protein P692DRAFT_20368783 [Suillus brevipes Sb2]|nr:hypothetical protein P692DRAFT_20368783 [Suillus brevipes Sb2]
MSSDETEGVSRMMPCLYVLYAVLYMIATVYVVKQGPLAIWRGTRNHLLQKRGLCQPYYHLIRSILSPMKQRGPKYHLAKPTRNEGLMS